MKRGRSRLPQTVLLLHATLAVACGDSGIGTTDPDATTDIAELGDGASDVTDTDDTAADAPDTAADASDTGTDAPDAAFDTSADLGLDTSDDVDAGGDVAPDTADDVGDDTADTPAPDVDCPESCDDGDPCTEDTVASGTVEGCDLVCEHRDIRGDDDVPDDAFYDANCDGIDGDAAGLVFVAFGGVDAADCGAPETPCATIRYATVLASERSADVAVSEGRYLEAIDVVDGVSIYGGYDRGDGWARSADVLVEVVSTLAVSDSATSASVYGLRARDITTETTVERLRIVAQGPTGDATGVSVVAVHVVNAPALALRYLSADAGNATPGAAGATGAAGSPGRAGEDGRSGGDTGTPPSGGTGGAGIFCPGRSESVGRGGGGGAGGVDDIPAACGTGTARPPRPGSGGSGLCSGLSGGSAGRSADLCPLTDITATSGGDGADCTREGSPGNPAPAPAVAHGGVDESGVWLPALGVANSTPSGYGEPGSGGPGGGGGGQGDSDVCVRGMAGGGGGGGGGGGCGGDPGQAGSGGGASIGLLAVRSEGLRIEESQFVAGRGGAGGRGGDGGAGGPGGRGGQPGSGRTAPFNACDVLDNDQSSRSGGWGGYGAAGGVGSGSGGGPGGASIGAVLCETAVDGGFTATASGAGEGGAGGLPGGFRGTDGLAIDLLEACGLDRPAIQVGVARAGTLSLYSIAADGTATARTADWGTCDAPYVLVAEQTGESGYWLCAPEAWASEQYLVGNGTAGPFFPLRGYFRGNESDRGIVPARICSGAPLLWDGGTLTTVFSALWVCLAPRRTTIPVSSADLLTRWVPQRASASPMDTRVVLTAFAPDPWTSSPDGLNLDAGYRTLVITLRNNSPGDAAELFFRRREDGAFAAERSVLIPMAPFSDETELIVDLAANPLWAGTIQQLRYDFTNAATGTVEVRSFEFRP